VFASAIWWSYLHDCCHSIYFALPSSYHPSEIELNLPCEEALWQASSSPNWFRVLQMTSPYGSSKPRLTGMSMPRSLASLSGTRLLITYIPINPFSHFILIHSILRHLFITCVEGRTTRPVAAGSAGDDETVRQEIYSLQYALHNWLQNWMNSPELPQVNGSNDEPPFVHNGTLTIACTHNLMYAYLSCRCQPFRFTGLVK
jgi:Fungal specific transcription factor domain